MTHSKTTKYLWVIFISIIILEPVQARQGTIGMDYSAGSADLIFTARYETNPDARQGVIWGANIVGLISGASLATNDLILLREYNDDPEPVPLGVPVHLGYTVHYNQEGGPRIVSKRHVTELPLSNQNYLYQSVHEVGHLSESYFSHDVYFQTIGVVNAYRTQNQTAYMILSHYPGKTLFGSMTSNKFIAIPLDHDDFQLHVPSIGSVVHLTGKTQSPGPNERRVYFENDHFQDLSVIKTIQIHDFSLLSGSFIPVQDIPLDTRLFQFSLDPSGSWTAIIHFPESSRITANHSRPTSDNQILLNTLYRGERSNYLFFERDGQLISQAGNGEITIAGYSFGLSIMHPYETYSNQYVVLWGSGHGRSSVHFEFGVDRNGNHFVDTTHDLGASGRFIAHTNRQRSVCNRLSAAEMASAFFSPTCSIDPATYTPYATLDLNRSGRKALIFQSCAGPETRGRFTCVIIEKRVDCTNLGTITTYSPNTVFAINYNRVDLFTSHAHGYEYHAVVAGDIHAEASGQIMVFEFDIDSQRYRFTSSLSE